MKTPTMMPPPAYLAPSEPRLARRPAPLAGTYIPELDGFRAIAVWMVLLTHTFGGFPDFKPGVLPGWASLLTQGYLGVDVFFVLSGFLITGILLDSREKKNYWRNFYGRRFLRIMPLYFSFVGVAAVLYSGYGSYFLVATGFLANFAGAFGISAPHGPSVLWSLAVEEQFYLIWPFAVLFLGRKRLFWLALGIVIVTPVLRALWRASGGHLDGMYLYSWFRFDGLALGAFLAASVRATGVTARHLTILSAGMLGLVVVVTLATLPFGVLQSRTVASGALRFTQVQLAVGAFILAAYTFRGSVWTWPLRSPFARISSDLSYCIYLIHLCFVDLYWYLEQQLGYKPANVSYLEWSLVRTVLVVLTAFSVAALSRKYLEQPCLRLKRYFS